MSAVMIFFYWIFIPVGVFRLARLLFLRADSNVKKGMVVAGTVVFFAWFLWIAIGRNLWLDHQVREMCAKDGGVKVFETVELTPDLLDWADRISIPFKTEAKPTDKYYIQLEKYYIHKDNPKMIRTTYRIIRRLDEKTLGESIYYGRKGGGLPGPWHANGFTCPDPVGRAAGLSTLVFRGDTK